MIDVREDSVFIIRSDFTLSISDEKVLSELYLPLIGNDAYALYHVLLNRANSLNREALVEEILKGCTLQFFSLPSSFLRLEALSLVRVFRKQDKERVRYLLIMKRPLSAFEFLESDKGEEYRKALCLRLGEKGIVHLKAEFQVQDQIEEGYLELTSSFHDAFENGQDLSSLASLSGEELNKSLYAKSKEESHLGFDKNILEEEITSLGGELSTYKNDEDEIVRIASLYGLDEKRTAHLLYEKCTDSEGIFSLVSFRNMARDDHHYAFKGIEQEKSDVYGDSSYAKLIRKADGEAPLDFLSESLGNTEVPLSYRRTLDKLSKDYKAPNSVINAVIYYTVRNTDGSFPEEYAIKVLLPILKKGIASAGDALTYLYQRDQKFKEKKEKKEQYQKEEETDKNPVTEETSSDKTPENGKDDDDDFDIDAITGGRL